MGVHIADVSHFIRPGTAIDKEAALRATTVYLVDKRIDMVPGQYVVCNKGLYYGFCMCVCVPLYFLKQVTDVCTSSYDYHNTNTLKCEIDHSDTEYRVLKVYVVTVV